MSDATAGDLNALREELIVLRGGLDDHDRILDSIGNARIVLLGEATHGTHEFYRDRATLTKRLIEERGFRALALEADWPDAHRASRFAQGANDDADAEQSLREFERFPTWMWRNSDFVDLVGWLRARVDNGRRPVGIYGWTSTASTAPSRP